MYLCRSEKEDCLKIKKGMERGMYIYCWMKENEKGRVCERKEGVVGGSNKQNKGFNLLRD